MESRSKPEVAKWGEKSGRVGTHAFALSRRARGAGRDGLGAGTQPPDESAGQHQADGDQLSAGHGAAEDRATAGIVAQIFEEESGDTVNEHERANDLAVEGSALEQPHEEEEIR